MDQKPRTAGVSPKLIAAVVTAVVTYLLGQEVLALPAWAIVLGQVVLVGLAAYAASPGNVITRADDDRGLTLVEVLVVLLIVLLVLFIVGAIR